jgi:hypothetical protein
VIIQIAGLDMRLSTFAVFLIVARGSATAAADYPALEEALAPAIEASALGNDQPVRVAVRNLTGLTPPWKLTEAIQSEIVFGLTSKQVKALNAGDDNLLDFLGQGKTAFTPRDLERARNAAPETEFLLGELKRNGQSPVLVLTRWDAKGGKVSTKEFPMESAALALDANVPPFNREVVTAATGKIGQWVGNESTWAYPAEILKQVGAARTGICEWGRELGPTEAWVPGDVIQFVGARFKQDKGKRFANYGRTTSIIEKITSPTQLELLHQSVNDQPVKRSKLNFEEFQDGYFVVFRPTKDADLVGLSRVRRLRDPKPDVQSDGSVNLLTMIDPQLDAIAGIWHRSDGPIEMFKENMAVLQIPYDVPDSYTLNLRVKRTSGTNTFGLGLKVGESRALIAMDAYDGITGFHRLNGKRANQNASTKKVRLFEQDQVVDLVCQVTPNSVTLKADDKVIVDWKGKAKDLTVDEKWKTPEKPWLFLGANDSSFEISRIKLTSP